MRDQGKATEIIKCLKGVTLQRKLAYLDVFVVLLSDDVINECADA